MKTRITIFSLLLISCFCMNNVNAEIADSSFNGFTFKHEYHINAAPDSVYVYFFRDISQWWSPLHTFSGNPANIVLQPKANGCFCERLANGGSVKHMTVVYAEPGKIFWLSGALGPLQMSPGEGLLTGVLKPAEKATDMVVLYSVGGYSPQSLGSYAPAVDKMIGDQFAGLKRFAESK